MQNSHTPPQSPISPFSMLRIPAKANLGEVIVYWFNVASCQGHVTITCWGRAWTAYFGGMPTSTIQEFARTTSTEYLTGKLLRERATMRERKYLAQIIDSIKQALQERQIQQEQQ